MPLSSASQIARKHTFSDKGQPPPSVPTRKSDVCHFALLICFCNKIINQGGTSSHIQGFHHHNITSPSIIHHNIIKTTLFFTQFHSFKIIFYFSKTKK